MVLLVKEPEQLTQAGSFTSSTTEMQHWIALQRLTCLHVWDGADED